LGSKAAPSTSAANKGETVKTNLILGGVAVLLSVCPGSARARDKECENKCERSYAGKEWWIKNCKATRCGAANLGAAGAAGAVGGGTGTGSKAEKAAGLGTAGAVGGAVAADVENKDDLQYRRGVQARCQALKAQCGTARAQSAAARQKLALAVSKINACIQTLGRKGKLAAMEAQKRYDEASAAFKEAGTAGLDVPVKQSNYAEVMRTKVRQIRVVVDGIYARAEKCAAIDAVPRELEVQKTKAEGIYDQAYRTANNSQPCYESEACMRDHLKWLDGYRGQVDQLAQAAAQVRCP
jgi:hypothetical protein